MPTVIHVDSFDRVDELVHLILSPDRSQPVIVVTQDRYTMKTDVDLSALQEAAKSDVYVMPTGDISRAFASRLPAKTDVYGGAARVYPPGDWWHNDPFSLPLRMPSAQQTELLLADLKKAAGPRLAVKSRSSVSAHITKQAQLIKKSFGRPGAAPKPGPVSKPGPIAKPGPLKRSQPSPDQMMCPFTAGTPISTAEDGERLAQWIAAPGRERPLVVISIPAGADVPYVDVDAVESAVGDLADICLLETGRASWTLSEHLPSGYDVYGGAARSYSPQLRLDGTELARIPLRFAWSSADGIKITPLLISDALNQAFASGYRSTLETHDQVEVKGVVQGVAGGRGLVLLRDRTMATVWPELTAPGIDAEQLLRKSMRIAGSLDSQTRRLDVSCVPAEVALKNYEPGATVLAVARQVAEIRVWMEIFPGVQAVLPIAEAECFGCTDLRDLISVDEVLPVRIVRSEPSWVVSLEDVDDDNALPAPSILPDGPPWLWFRTPEPEPEESKPEQLVVERLVVEQVVVEKTPESVSQELDALRVENANQRQQLAESASMIKRLRQELEQAKGARRAALDKSYRTEKALRQAERELGQAVMDGQLFSTREDQLRFDVYVAWVRRTTAADKVEWPLAEYEIGQEFFPTWDNVQGVEYAKVIDVIVDVLTGRDALLPSRELHMLRQNDGGDSGRRARADGATAWRVSLQIKTPSARRLHYWRKNDGAVELASIRLHDDVQT